MEKHKKDDKEKAMAPTVNRAAKECEPIDRWKERARPQKRTGTVAAEVGLTEQEAINEAQRCLGFRDCSGCEVCSLVCPDLCITYDERSGEPLMDLDFCKGCGICACLCPKGAIQMVLEEGNKRS